MNTDSSKAKRARRSGGRDALRTQLRETVKIAILDAAEQRIGANGMHATSLAEIAREAGVAVGTLYNYFTDRDALVRDLLETRRASLRPQLEATMAGFTELAFEPRLRAITRELFETFERHRLYLKILFQAEHIKPEKRVDFFAMFTRIFEEGAAAKVIAAKHVPTLALVYTGSLRMVLMRRIADGTPFVTDADPIVSLLLDGARRG